MNQSNKYIATALITTFIIYQIFIISTEFTSTRDIPVRRTIFNTHETEYLTSYNNYSVQGYPYEEYTIRVKPGNFGDFMNLTNYDGNFLSLSLNVISLCLLILYIFKIDKESFLKGKYFNLLWIICGLFLFSIEAHMSGYFYTENFWEKLFAAKSGGEQLYTFEQVHGSNPFFYLIVMTVLFGIYKETIKKHNNPESSEVESINAGC